MTRAALRVAIRQRFGDGLLARCAHIAGHGGERNKSRGHPPGELKDARDCRHGLRQGEEVQLRANSGVRVAAFSIALLITLWLVVPMQLS